VSTADHADVNRRDFLMIATGAVAGVGAVLTAWPFINQMNPDAAVLALSSIEVDLASITEGQSVTFKWRGNPLIVRHRTKSEIDAAKAVKMEDLKDPVARNLNAKGNLDASDENRVVGGKENYHLGCVPDGDSSLREFAVVEGSSKTGGWFCPCHGSQYDTAGRVRKGPAPYNLDVPPYVYLTDTKIRVG
jgi:ubiquinol-cytochrome c reductase iron-sulfur subunit